MEIAVGSQPGVERFGGDAYVSETVAPSVALLAVADSFGGARGNAIGAVALSAVSEVLRRRFRGGFASRSDPSLFIRGVLLSAFSCANARVFAQSGNHDDCVAGGASVTAVLLAGERLFVAHVGEARAYLLRDGAMVSLTEDDSLVFESSRNTRSVIPVEPPRRTLLTRTLGTQPTLEATILELAIRDDDQIIVCTNGVHRFVGSAELCSAVVSGETPADAVSTALSLTRAREVTESGTIIVARTLVTAPANAVDSAERSERIRRAVTIGGMVSVLAVIAVLLLVYGIHV